MDIGRRRAARPSVMASPTDRLGRQIETYGSEGGGSNPLRVRRCYASPTRVLVWPPRPIAASRDPIDSSADGYVAAALDLMTLAGVLAGRQRSDASDRLAGLIRLGGGWMATRCPAA